MFDVSFSICRHFKVNIFLALEAIPPSIVKIYFKMAEVRVHYFKLIKIFAIICMALLLLQNAKFASGANDDSFENEVKPSPRLNPSSLNSKVTGIMLKTEGRQYYVSSELCPGGVFLTKPVPSEKCLCYNGIFQIVRQCCDPSSTRLDTDQLEWRMDFKCGSSASPETMIGTPIRAILPLTKTFNRDGSILMDASIVGKNISQWRRFDLDDIIIRNNKEVTLRGKRGFEIVHIKPLGENIRIWFGEHGDISVCYSGWVVEEGLQNLRVILVNAAPTRSSCCINLNQVNVPGMIDSTCSLTTIYTELIEVNTADEKIGQCQPFLPSEAIHRINKRSLDPSKVHLQRHPYDRIIPFKYRPPTTNKESSKVPDDLLGDQGPVLFKRQYELVKRKRSKSLIFPRKRRQGWNDTSSNSAGSSINVLLLRKKGLASEELVTQQKTINEFIAILRNDPTAQTIEPEKFLKFHLLKKSVEIMTSVIPTEIVPHPMLHTAFDVFFFLYESLEVVTYEPPEIHKRTLQYLTNCGTNSKPKINFTVYGCPNNIDQVVITPEIKEKLKSYYKGNPTEFEMRLKSLRNVAMRQDKRFVAELYDIYVDINWKVVDFVNSYCFDFFKEEFNAHHFYEKQMESLFLHPEVQRRWFTKRPKGLKYARGIFPVSNLERRMNQLDKVVAVGHHLSRYNGTYWLRRPRIDPWRSRLKTAAKESDDALLPDRTKQIFYKSLMDDAHFQTEDLFRKSMIIRNFALAPGEGFTSLERESIYPFQAPEKLPPGELIWDGKAICLHAKDSSENGYFVDSEMWGVTPSLAELGRLYPLELGD